MRLSDFDAMVRRMAGEVPEEFLAGIAEIVVSPGTVTHPQRPEVYTLGECIPLPSASDEPGTLQSRILLYHGSFAALARDDPGFDWREEAWETLTHEVRHHVEWRARVPDLEALDQAAEQNYARHEGEPFDPTFYRDGERLPGGLFRVEDDYFMERVVTGPEPTEVPFTWRARSYRVKLPGGARLPLLVSVGKVDEAPEGELVLVLRRRPGWRDLFRRTAPMQLSLEAEPLAEAG